MRSLDQTFKSASILPVFRAFPWAGDGRHASRGPMRSPLAVWRDRRGRVSWLRIATLCALVAPVLIAVVDGFADEGYGARPINNLIHRAGYWALLFLLAALAVTPLTRIARYGALMDVRRMIGVGAFVYAAAHILLYVVDQTFDLVKVASEIVLRVYLTIGFTALVGLSALALTSTDGMVKELGPRRWQRLHQAVYGIALLALIHFFQQTKADEWLPTFVAGLFAWMMGYRIVMWRMKGAGELTPWALLGLTVAVSALVFVVEAVGLGIAFNVSPLTVLGMSVDFDLDTIRPGWLVLGAGLCVVALGVVRSWWRKPRARAGTPSTTKAPARELA
jgi:methionine sulfoxide reductase heme-binding subunit